MWRTELWHSFIVHLPVVTLFLSSIAAILKLFISNTVYRLFLTQTVWIMLIIGVASGWVAIYTGELAYTIEVRKICDAEVLRSYQWWAYATLIVYSFTLVTGIASKISGGRFLSIIKIIKRILLFIGLTGLLYTGHLGASLVYQQDAQGMYSIS